MARKPNGFTLIELMVVVGVIVLLVAVLMPALAKARETAKTVQCLGNLRQIGMAALIYSGQNDGWLLSNCETWMPEHDGKIVVPAGGGCAWYDDIFNLLGKNLLVLECPSGDCPRRTDNYLQMQPPYGPRQYYPGYFVNGAVRTQYFNYPTGTQWSSGFMYLPTRGLRISQFKNPWQKIWYGDSGMGLLYDMPPALPLWRTASCPQWWHARQQSSDHAMLSGRHGKLGGRTKYYAAAYSTPQLVTAGGKGNVVFFDGHAETVDCLDVWPDCGLTYTSAEAVYGKYWDPDGDGCAGTPVPQ
jgi:prepilin-type N-terminal cleavage/methylation domain-containing protein/prepilin-type processing-associated H-X9-DG protein